MNSKTKKNRLQLIIRLIVILLLLCLSCYPFFSYAAPAAPKTETREDGLTVLKAAIPKEEIPNLCLITLVAKTGYADDPEGKAGLTELMNRLLYLIFSNSSALNVAYYTSAEFSKFNFVVSAREFKSFMAELDSIIRTDALLLYDECNQLIQDYKNQPRSPGFIAEINLYRLLYGNSHPYLAAFNANYADLDIDAVNTWFRKVYRPNNLLIASTTDLPSDFLMRPSGREMREVIRFPEIPAVNCAPKPVIRYNQIQDNVANIYIGLPGSSITENSLFAMMVTQRFLQKELWNKLREEMGLCYDLQVSYSYLQEPTASPLIISLATLPADADTAIAEIIRILTGIATAPLASEQLSSMKEQEKNRAKILYNSIFRRVDGLLYERIFGLAWLKDSESYLNLFDQVTPEEISKFTAQQLKYLKVSVAGPFPAESFAEAYRAISTLNKSLK